MLQSLDKINGRLNRILQLVYLNFLWGGLVIAGLGVFTFGPASYAMVAVIRKWLRTKESFPLTKTYFSYFKENYRETLLMSWIYGVIGVVLLVDLSFIHNWYLRIALYIAAFLYLLSALYIFPKNENGIFVRILSSSLFISINTKSGGDLPDDHPNNARCFNLYRWQSLLFRSHVDSKFYILPFGMEELIYRKNRRKQKYH